MGIYEELGIRPILNANATLTRLGGSRLAPGVAEAMAEAGHSFVDIVALQKAVGAEIARLTQNEACYVSSGAAAGLTLATAACIAGTDPELRARLPFTDGLKNEVIIHRHTRVQYDFAVRMTGVRFVEIGGPRGTTAEELDAAITPQTAAMFVFPRAGLERGELAIETAAEVCHARGVRVIVDAAAQLPLRSNLWNYTQRGADAAVFSGGKGLRGPQPTGLVLGKRDLIEAMALHGPPNPYIGRGMKVGKEELCGILAAVRWYLAHDEEAELAFYETATAQIVQAFEGHPVVQARRGWPSEAGQPMPLAELQFDEAALGRTTAEVMAGLRDGEPSVDVADFPEGLLRVNPHTLEPEEVPILIRRLLEELTPRV
ncbi:MAG: aminotransferase class V-fold PLP-dependent enzyme [Actinomycetota bacterium]